MRTLSSELGLPFQILILLISLILTACGEGGVNGPTSLSTIITFTPETASSGSDTVYMAENSSLSSGDILAIDVKANDISGSVFGAAFDVDFDSSKITYNDYAPGNFLEQGGNTVNYSVALQADNSGKLLVGISREAPATGTTGSGTIVTLKFKAIAVGSTPVDFSSNALTDSSGQIISGITWSGGTVMVQ